MPVNNIDMTAEQERRIATLGEAVKKRREQ